MNTFNFKLTDEHLAIIDAGVRKLPFEVAKPFFDDINRQIDSQSAVEHDLTSAHVLGQGD